jgi:UPF0755 protein
MLRSTVASGLAILVLLALYVCLQAGLPLTADNVVVEVRKGESFGKAVSAFYEAGLVRDPRLFKVIGRITGLENSLQPGEYAFNGPVTMLDVYRAIRDNDILPSRITVVEGDSLLEIRDKLSAEGYVTPEDFDRLVYDKQFIASLGIEAESLEGYLFPDTYRFDKGAAPEEIIAQMVRRFKEIYGPEFMARTKELGWSVRQVLTLASIIEHEAVLDSEREIISAVYHNRLRLGMRLQADPTAIYGIKPLSEGVTAADVRRVTPYNTYVISGLPPGPIASPGKRSIRAALYPAAVPYLYFVAQGDGSHKFSSSSQEHNRAVRKYRERKNEHRG